MLDFHQYEIPFFCSKAKCFLGTVISANDVKPGLGKTDYDWKCRKKTLLDSWLNCLSQRRKKMESKLSNEKHPGWLGLIGDEILPKYIGDYFINHDIRIPINQPV